MVKHIVTFKLKGAPDVRRSVSQQFKEALEALPEVIDCLQSIEVGINENPAEDWDVVLTAILPAMEDVAVYAGHPAHVAAASILGPYKESRACVDYEC
ncbi:MAG: Dabb family protein [Muribaculaceae bacterium]|nr:Dabb family protein [Muribaculaceae bacterium]